MNVLSAISRRAFGADCRLVALEAVVPPKPHGGGVSLGQSSAKTHFIAVSGRVGGVLGVVGRLVDLGLDSAAIVASSSSVRTPASRSCAGSAAARPRLQVGELLGGAVLRLLVVGGVGGEADDLGLDERRAVAAPRRSTASLAAV
jgi:hypothetical protein